eukprot:763344-Hanusia_phi.AAC.2
MGEVDEERGRGSGRGRKSPTYRQGSFNSRPFTLGMLLSVGAAPRERRVWAKVLRTSAGYITHWAAARAKAPAIISSWKLSFLAPSSLPVLLPPS